MQHNDYDIEKLSQWKPKDIEGVVSKVVPLVKKFHENKTIQFSKFEQAYLKKAYLFIFFKRDYFDKPSRFYNKGALMSFSSCSGCRKKIMTQLENYIYNGIR